MVSNPTFQDFNLGTAVQNAVAAENYTTPTPIQAAAIPHLLAGRDLLGCAQTGTGKTAAFALPILHQLDAARIAAVPRQPRVLVLAPTRELAGQIGDSFAAYGKFVKFRQTVIFGGVGQMRQVRALERGVHVLVATPGRLLDLMQQGHVRLDRLETFVLDEADRMLDLGFLPDLRRIIAALPARRHSVFFSATMPPKVAELAESLLANPVRVEITPPATTVERIDQRVMMVSRQDKRALLEEVLLQPEVGLALVFTKTKRGANIVSQQLERAGIRAEAIHGNKSQNARERALESFRTGKVRVLVATDLAARGIDIEGITHVINYELPMDPESYVHRIGRTGRAGADGIAVSFCDATERGMLRQIEKVIGRGIEVDAGHAFHSNQPAAEAPASGLSRPGRRRRFGQPQGGKRRAFGSKKKFAGAGTGRGGRPSRPRN